MIRPDLTSAMQRCDPWRDYEISRRGRAEREAPYQGLLKLIGQLRHEPSADSGLQDAAGQPVALTAESRTLLLAWCQKNGLLGILPHRARLITLTPYWRRQVIPVEQGDADDEPYEVEWFPHQNSLGLFGGSWRWVRRTQAHPDAEHHRDDLLTPAELPLGWPAPSAMTEDLQLGVLTRGSLKDVVWRFFPDVPADQAETYQYPVPLGDPFWQQYAEPVADFIRGAVAFAQAARKLGKRKRATRQEAVHTLHAMTGAVRVGVELVPGGTYRQRWRSPSLLALYALMLLRDLATHRQVRQCKACGQVFAAAAYQRAYCTETCRNRVQKRAYRKRQRATATGITKKKKRRSSGAG